MKLDSKEGIAQLMKWAKTSRFVLYPYHRRLAQKHGVPTDGVIFADPLP